MHIKNPFKYGVVVTGDDFVNRKEEIKILSNNLLSGQNIILYSSRRLGKTSLMKQTMHLLPKKVLPIYIDLFGITSKKTLIKRIVNELMITTYPKVTLLRNAIQRLLSKITIRIVIVKDTIELEVKGGEEITSEELEEVFDLPEKIAGKQGKQLIIMFDEFQDITDIDEKGIEKIMRSKFQHHTNVSYLFAGSKISMMHTLFHDSTRAFYKFGKAVHIGNIPKKEFTSFIKTKFEKTGKKIDTNTIEKILRFTDGHPYYTQKLCQQIWYDAVTIVDENLVANTILKIARDESDFYEQIWNSLTMLQKRLLIGFVIEPKANKYAHSFIGKYNLKSTAHVKRAFDSLEKKRVLEKGEITDIFFLEWIKIYMT